MKALTKDEKNTNMHKENDEEAANLFLPKVGGGRHKNIIMQAGNKKRQTRPNLTKELNN